MKDGYGIQISVNGIKLLNGSKEQVHFQIGINASDALAVDLDKADSITLGLGGTSGVRTITSNRMVKTDYSAATIAKTDIKINEYIHILKFDNDSFNKWDAAQNLYLNCFFKKSKLFSFDF